MDPFQACLNSQMLFVAGGIRRHTGLRITLSHNRLLEENVHALGVEALTIRHYEKLVQHVAAELGRTRLPCNSKVVTATGDFDIEAAFYLPQVFVKLAAKVGETAVIGWLENDIPRYLDCIQDRCFRPLYMV